ncbi:poly(A) RNA polymerase, mitochondrial-like [Aricia agestis]|uniref:poly(A) RNA polymerase, mitochondrial-like n=1 Tax=Aricia agestis TaxID=91739 RepID=UPI001C206DE9|nr:poly(A) RNA polymerase, mitochondrial-like [Aricia agestis]
MSVLFQTGKLHLPIRHFRNKFIKFQSLKCSSDAAKKFVVFDEVNALRRAQAQRSLVVQVSSESSFKELYGYCSKYATISDIHHYKNTSGEHFMLIEFENEENLTNILQQCSSHQKDLDVMPIQSPFLWFRAVVGSKESANSSKELAIKDGNCCVDEDLLLEELAKCETVSDQIMLLYQRTMLNDIGIRLRFMVARQMEMIFQSLYSNIVVQPFGSSVNGFGKMGCDLDLVLTNVLTKEMTSASRRLVYQDKKYEGRRTPWQRHLELIAHLLQLRAPGASRVQAILNARVPIVKYSHDLTDLDCDLCYNNTSGVYMSELLWLYGSVDARVRPLTFAVRRWARAVGITQPHPGRWVTNFPLTLMVLFFLQQTRSGGAILPSFKYLVNKSGREDIRIAEENLNCTFLRDLNKLPASAFGQNTDKLETLLFQFFEFYSQFDFQERAISINEGTSIRKPNASPLYIVNPLEQAMNVSRNVSYEECERLKLEIRNAAWHLETSLDNKKGDDWGLLGLIEKKTARGLKQLLRLGNLQRLVSVKDLFKDDENEPSTEGIKSKLQKFGKNKSTEKTDSDEKSEKVKFKNSQIAKEVFRIRRDKIL